MIGQKLARLGALLSSGRAPENETIDDTFLDSLTYQGLMYDKWKRNQEVDRIECAHAELTIKGLCKVCQAYVSDKVIQENYNFDLPFMRWTKKL